MISFLTSFAVYALGLPRWLIWPFYGFLLLLIFWNFYRLARNNYIVAKNEEEALKVFQFLIKRGFHVISDIVGEQVITKKEADKAQMRYMHHIDSIKNNAERIAIAVKPSQCGLYIDHQFCRKIIGSIVYSADRHHIFVWLDAEKKSDRDAVFHIAYFLKFKKLDNFGVAIQANHSDAKIYFEKYLRLGISVRLVKGAYTDGDLKSSAVDKNFYKLVDFYVDYLSKKDDSQFLALGTHDKNLITYAESSAKELQFLYDVNSKLAEEMAGAGKRVFIYGPWGNKPGAYLYRRFREGMRFKTFFLFLRNLWSGYWFRRRLAKQARLS